jgi:hypothetical protein
MKATDLNLLFAGVDTGAKLSSSIRAETSEYSDLIKKRGSTIPISFDEEDHILVDETALANLFRAILTNKLSNTDLAYICDCLTLCENIEYSNDNVKNIVFDSADPEINGGLLNYSQVKELLDAVDPTQTH